MSPLPSTRPCTLQLTCRGVVQGVGFRPLVHRLARERGLTGTVRNGSGEVRLELEGERSALEEFLVELPRQLPAGARLEPLDPRWLPPGPATGRGSPPTVRLLADAPVPLDGDLVAPALVADRAPCPACLAELADPSDRRAGYPFISCCDCGPRFSIATAEPWTRAHTTLAAFPPCEDCRREFADPASRRFHAETISCPRCGPRLRLLDPAGTVLAAPPAGAANGSQALIQACCERLDAGEILALQGVGGFQLLVDATSAAAVRRLRQRKRRPARPFALLVARAEDLARHCRIGDAERRALAGPAAPIVLLRRRRGRAKGLPGVAPGSPCLGAMLPASALHHLLVHAFGRPLVATSGNPSGEPLCIDPAEALQRLGAAAGPIADVFLVHDCAIARPLDDSLLQVIDGRPAMLRRARGHVPEPVPLPAPGDAGDARGAVLALGGDLKSAPALLLEGRVWLSPHLGDLAGGRQLERLADGLAAIGRRWGDRVRAVACDAHPGYLSHQIAAHQPWPRHPVQHHQAHGLAVLAEHGLQTPLLAFTWDGLGYAPPALEPEGAFTGAAGLWGGELLLLGGSDGGHVRRLVGLRPFPLPGGERAMEEPRRAALGLLIAAGVAALEHPGAARTLAAFGAAERRLLQQAVATGCNSPVTTSMGRLFDAVASLLGLVQRQSHEGEGGLRLQGAAASAAPCRRSVWPLPLVPTGSLAGGDGSASPALGWLDWQPLLHGLLTAIAAGTPRSVCAARFQRSLVRALVETALSCLGSLRLEADLAGRDGPAVALSGGCFQNRQLLEAAIRALRARGLRPFWPERLPCNDGGLALGQIRAVAGAWADRPAVSTNGESVPAPPPADVPGCARSHSGDPHPSAPGNG